MHDKTSNTGGRSHAIRTILAIAAMAVAIAWQTAPAAARERHHAGHRDHHHHGMHEATATKSQSGQTVGRTFTGVASQYGNESGSQTASGQRMNPEAMTAAHRTLPFGTRVRVTLGGRSVIVTINDRGPFVRGRVLDLSTGAARAIGLAGIGQVTAEVLS